MATLPLRYSTFRFGTYTCIGMKISIHELTIRIFRTTLEKKNYDLLIVIRNIRTNR